MVYLPQRYTLFGSSVVHVFLWVQGRATVYGCEYGSHRAARYPGRTLMPLDTLITCLECAISPVAFPRESAFTFTV